MDFRITDKPSEQEINEIYKGLLKYNLERIENKDVRELGIFQEDEAESIISGLVGQTHGNWLEVKYLWVDEAYRGQDIGTKLIEAAEKTAKERGCKFSFLNTFGFQARGFYLKQGYKEVFTLNEYPLTGTRHYLTKTL
ncbi:GNAT family N-acetyltransferase [bacterium]|nr:GNAT family N-acetyltransferase [bacterium]